MKLEFLGTGAWYPFKRPTSCCLLRTKKTDFVLDAGTGIAQLRNKKLRAPFHLLYTHTHPDHVEGLFYLNDGSGSVNKGVAYRVYGPDKNKLRSVVGLGKRSKHFKEHFTDLKQSKFRIGDARITALRLKHGGKKSRHGGGNPLGYKIEADGKKFAYITDTGYCKNAVRLARDCNACVIDSTILQKDANLIASHCTAKQAARIALEAGAKKLYLYHYRISYGEKELKKLLKEARSVFKESYLSREGLVVTV